MRNSCTTKSKVRMRTFPSCRCRQKTLPIIVFSWEPSPIATPPKNGRANCHRQDSRLSSWRSRWFCPAGVQAHLDIHPGRIPYKPLQLQPSVLAGPSDSLRADVPRDRLMLLRLVGSFVLLLDGGDAESDHATRRRSLEEPGRRDRFTVILSDSAKGPAQLS